MKRDKHVIIEDINHIEEDEYENDVFLDEKPDLNFGCLAIKRCFNLIMRLIRPFT